MLFFTHTPIDFPKKKREAWGALPADDDLITWRRIDIGLAPGRSGIPVTIGAAWADMFVFRRGDRVFATFKQSDGLVCEAENQQLTSWKTIGNLGGMHTQTASVSSGHERMRAAKPAAVDWALGSKCSMHVANASAKTASLDDAL